MIETIYDGAPKTPFMKFGDTVEIRMEDEGGKSIFGAITQLGLQRAQLFLTRAGNGDCCALGMQRAGDRAAGSIWGERTISPAATRRRRRS